MGVLYVTSPHDGAGKTAFCAGLADLLRQRGHNPALFKPLHITSSIEPAEMDADATFFARLQGGASTPGGWPVVVEAVETQAGLRQESIERVLAAFEALRSQTQEIIVEGPSMANSEGDALAVASVLADALDARVGLLVQYSPTLQAEDIVGHARSLGHRLLGVVINGVRRYRNHAVQTALVTPLEKEGIPVLAVLSEERCLVGVTVGQIADHLGGEFLLWDEKRDQLVEHFMIGGWILDSGAHYFGQSESKAVIVRGDRPDMQMAALSTPTRCLVLTGGHRPIQYVEYEAKEEEVPMVLVEADTLATANALATLFDEVTVHHPAKVECFAQALERSMNVEAMASVLGGV